MYDKREARAPSATPNPQRPTPNAQLPTPKVPPQSSSWNPRKPFDLRERLFDFGLLIIRMSQFLHTRGPVASALSHQILRCGTSAGANYEEADDGSSDRDALAKKKIVLRELKESRWRLRLVRAAGFLGADHDPVIKESDELVKIVATIVRNDQSRL